MQKAAVNKTWTVVSITFTLQQNNQCLNTLPRLPKSNLALLQKNRMMMLSMLDIYNQEIKKNKQTHADEDEQDNLNATMNRIKYGDHQDKEMRENPCTLALHLLDQNLIDTSTAPVRAIEGLLKLSGCPRMPNNRRDFLWYPVTITWRSKSLLRANHRVLPCRRLGTPSQSVWCRPCCVRLLHCHAVCIQIVVYCRIKPTVGRRVSW